MAQSPQQTEKHQNLVAFVFSFRGYFYHSFCFILFMIEILFSPTELVS